MKWATVVNLNDVRDRDEAVNLLSTGAAAWFEHEVDRITTDLTRVFENEPAKLALILHAIDQTPATG